MPRNISFALTTRQFRDLTKTVTRRVGWVDLKVGDTLCGVEKSQGLKKGESPFRLGLVRVKSVRREPLRAMLDWRTFRGKDPDESYGQRECRLEWFASLAPADFVDMFCKSHKGCKPDSEVTRIEFEYLDGGDAL